MVRLRLEQAELSQCHDKLSELKSERLTLLSDIEAIRRQQNDGGVNINKQLVEVDKKIVEINDQIAEDRGHLENYHRQSTGNSTDEEERAEEELRILTKISEAQRAVRSYQERQRELKARLESGVLTEVALAKLNDLQVLFIRALSNLFIFEPFDQDNLDAMNAEISFYVNRVAGNQKLNSVNPWSTNSSKAQDSEIGSRDTDRSKTDALFAELQRMDEATSTRLLLFLTHQMIDTKFRLAIIHIIAIHHSCLWWL